MSVIGVKNIPTKWTLKFATKALTRAVRGHFQPINFAFPPQVPKKTFFIKLSDLLDPKEIVIRINTYKEGQAKNLFAFIPRKEPDLPMAGKSNLPRAFRRYSNESERKGLILRETFVKLNSEIFLKYPNVKKIPTINGNKFLDKIAQKVCDRLISMALVDPKICNTHFYLSRLYRKVYPHYTDFDFIKQCIVELDAELGNIQPTVVTEEELSKITDVRILQTSELREKCIQFTVPVMQEVKKHIDALDSEPSPMDTDEEAVQKKVRAELKKVNLYLEHVVDQVTEKITYKKRKLTKVDVYGEPYLPTLPKVMPIFKDINIRKVIRSNGMYNLVRFKIRPEFLKDIIELDGTCVGNAKLRVRPFQPRGHVTSNVLMTRLQNTFIQDNENQAQMVG